MEDLFTISSLGAFAQVIFIDIALAADNAVVIGLVAAGLEPTQRKKAIFWGIIAATVLRILFASVAVQLLQVIGLLLAGGILLLWVCWKMWTELHPEGLRAVIAAWQERRRTGVLACADEIAEGELDNTEREEKSLRQAVVQIIVADISMSIDNVLAVAGAARDHPAALVFGLVLSIALMGLLAMWIARLLERHKWIAYLGIAVVLFVAFHMIIEGAENVLRAMSMI